LWVITGLLCFGLVQEIIFSSPSGQKKESQKPEVISLLGKELFATPAEGDELRKLQEDLQEALLKVESDPENPESFVLYGRRLAYLWRYHDAIEIYTKGIKAYPNHALLYRHRGHRFLSIRKFEDAVADLTKASQLNEGDFDIWYHLGLAHYLQGEFDEARQAYEKCQSVAEDDDARIAISNWLYITLRRLGKNEKAKKLLQGITEEMNVVENQSYCDLLLFYKGLKEESEIVEMAKTSDLNLATIGYGIGCWHLYNNESEKAMTYFEAVVQTPYWPAFGYIAAEAEQYRVSLKE
jgi:tetratricopeptide (TPR) repeat protein